MEFNHNPRSKDYALRVRKFIREQIRPVEEPYLRELREKHRSGDWTRWTIAPIVDELKARARVEGLWNLFLPDAKLGAGLSTLEYAPVAQETGKSLLLQRVVDEAIQMHGGAGVSDDVPLTGLFAMARSLRIADGPDEVHRGVIARVELLKYKALMDQRSREDA